MIVGSNAISPEMWQQMGRLHSATFLHDHIFNLPDEFKEPIDQVLFGKKIIIPKSQRIERGLYKIVSTHVMLLTMFMMMFIYIFRN